MTNYDFIEIGTSNYDTLIELADDNTVGISVEPLDFYLDQLPNKKNVIKICKAITAYPTTNKIDIYFVPPKVIDEIDNLPQYFKGCNSIGNYHPAVIESYKHLFETRSVDLISIKDLLETNNVAGIGHLKIDTEGHDCVILNGFLDYLGDKPKNYYPKQITFESNHLTSVIDVDNVIERFIKIGYIIVSRGHDTVLKVI